MYTILLVTAGTVIGILVGYFIRLIYAKSKLSSAEQLAKKIIADATKEAEVKKKEGLIEIKEKMHQERIEFEKETKQRRYELTNFERRLNQKEENIEKKVDIMEKREKENTQRESTLNQKTKLIEEEEKQLNQKNQEQRKILERISGMSSEEAKKILIQNMEEEAKKDAGVLLKRIEQETKENATKKAKEIISVALSRCASDYTQEITTSTVTLPNDEMKGRIIGREGRNIRTFEQLTGVDLIIDDTPEAITVSSLDPTRRETARIALEKLIADGRIQPGRIEEVIEHAKKEFENIIVESGRSACLSIGIANIHPEIIKMIGKLKFRTSYGQNQLQHTLEVATIAGNLAAELGADVVFCKKAGLFHDIGKAIDRDVEGTHHQISADIAKQYGESEKMINAILSHHEGLVEPKSVEAFVLLAADAISASRPGVRRESIEQYLKRIEKLEKVASSFRGVEKSYAIQAGREIRIMVEPEDIDDASAMQLAKDIAKKIETELEYPGQIKVTVIREVRAQEIAK